MTSMIRKTKTKIKKMVNEHKHLMQEHKHMMGFHVLIAILVGVVLHMLFPPTHAQNEHAEPTTIIVQEHQSASDIEQQRQERINTSLKTILDTLKEEPHVIPNGIASPNLSLKISADMQGGYNLFLGTENFAFTPQRIGVVDESAYYEGHASLYINDQFISRVYSPYHYIPDHLLTEENNVLLVTLSDNTHNPFTRNGDIIYDADTISY